MSSGSAYARLDEDGNEQLDHNPAQEQQTAGLCPTAVNNPRSTNFIRRALQSFVLWTQTVCLKIWNTPQLAELCAIALVYLVQGVTDLAVLAQRYLLKDELKAEPAEVALVMSLANVPWMLKPLIGFVSDSLPLCGFRRKSYLLLAGLTGAAGWLLLSVMAHSMASVFLLITLTSLASAVSDVVVDSMVVERARREQQADSGSLQSLCWASYAVGQIATSYFSGSLVQQYGPRFVFLLTALLPLCVTASAMTVKEMRVEGPCSRCLRLRRAARHARQAAQAKMEGVRKQHGWLQHVPGLSGSSPEGYEGLPLLTQASSSKDPPVVDHLDALDAARRPADLPSSTGGAARIRSAGSSGGGSGLQPVVALPPPQPGHFHHTTAVLGPPGQHDQGGGQAPAQLAPSLSHATREAAVNGHGYRHAGDANDEDEEDGMPKATAWSLFAGSVKRLWAAFSRREVLGPVAFLLVMSATPAADDAMFYFQTNELKFSPSFLGGVQLAIAVAGLIGVGIYNVFLRNVPLRPVLFWGSVLAACCQATSLILVTHANRWLGLDDHLFALGDSVLVNVITNVMFMPTMVLSARLCPEGVEATMFATLMSLMNAADGIRYASGAGLMWALGVNEHNYKNLAILVAICSVALLLPLPLLVLLPSQYDSDEALKHELAAGAGVGDGEEGGVGRQVEARVDEVELQEGVSERMGLLKKDAGAGHSL